MVKSGKLIALGFLDVLKLLPYSNIKIIVVLSNAD